MNWEQIRRQLEKSDPDLFGNLEQDDPALANFFNRNIQAQLAQDCGARPLPYFTASDVALLGQMGVKL